MKQKQDTSLYYIPDGQNSSLHVYLSSYEWNQTHISTEHAWNLHKHLGFIYSYKEI